MVTVVLVHTCKCTGGYDQGVITAYNPSNIFAHVRLV